MSTETDIQAERERIRKVLDEYLSTQKDRCKECGHLKDYPYQRLFTSRRFQIAAITVALLWTSEYLGVPIEDLLAKVQSTAVVVGAWIIGDALRKT